MKKFRSHIAVLALALLTACSGAPTRLGSTTAEPARDVDFSKGRAIEAEACGFQLLLFIPIAINGRMANANTDLVAAAHGDYISDVKITESWKYAFVGTLYCTKLSATAYPKK